MKLCNLFNLFQFFRQFFCWGIMWGLCGWVFSANLLAPITWQDRSRKGEAPFWTISLSLAAAEWEGQLYVPMDPANTIMVEQSEHYVLQLCRMRIHTQSPQHFTCSKIGSLSPTSARRGKEDQTPAQPGWQSPGEKLQHAALFQGWRKGSMEDQFSVRLCWNLQELRSIIPVHIWLT